MARDLYHYHVSEALEQHGWSITNDPYLLRAKGIDYEVDMGAEKLLAASKQGVKIAVEVKSFNSSSDTYEFHKALGQFNSYFLALRKQEPDRELFLAVPQLIYDEFFIIPFIQEVIEFYKLKIIVFNASTKTIVKWIK